MSKAIALALAVAALAAQPSPAQTIVPNSVYAGPQTLVPIDGARRLNLYCSGSGSPVVILDAGAGAGMAAWRLVQAEIAKVTRVCAYDRAGLGFSDEAQRPSDVADMVDDLRRLTRAARIPSPFVYVGHSLAGMVALLYVATYPEDIAGAVLVDPSFAGQIEAMQAALPPDRRNAVVEGFERAIVAKRACLALARQGELADPKTPEARTCLGAGALSDDDLGRAIARQQTLPRVWEAQISELSSMAPHDGRPGADSLELQAAEPSFGDKPLAVLTAGGMEAAPGGAAWRAGHDRIAALSSRGDNTIVPGAGHNIQVDRPQAVIDAVRRVVAVARLR